LIDYITILSPEMGLNARIHFYSSPNGLTVLSQLWQCSKDSVRCTKYLR